MPQAETSPKLSWPDLSAPAPAPAAGFEKGSAFVDGRIVPIEEATIPLLDWGFLRSDAFQETVSVWNGNVFRIADHLARFRRSGTRLRMPIGHSDDEIREIIHGLVRVCNFRNAYVQIINTRGRPPVGSRDLRLCESRFRAFCMPYMWLAPPSLQEQGMSLHVSSRVRVPPSSVDPMVKHYHWLDFEMGLLDAYDEGCETVVLQDGDGNVTEGPGFNIFAIIDGHLCTPKHNMLDGMTRRTVIEIAAHEGIPITETAIRVDKLTEAREIFLTTTAGGVIPVTNVDGQSVGNGRPGLVTARLHRLYWARREAGWNSDPIDYEKPLETVAVANSSLTGDR
ncbi:aminotransferase class IV [Hoeflea sp.]|uniref:aminotransferase class IV n=1 Tax=Hoeflea sp. TaxID=1940281 RepID=UPI003A8E53DF